MSNIPRREGLKNIGVNEAVEFELSVYNFNKFGKKQFSGFVGDKFMYLPTHQQLVDKLEKVPIGSKVKAKRLTQGGPKEACNYEVVVLEGPNGTEPMEIADYETSDNSSAIMKTISSCLKNNCSAPQMMMILKKEFSDEELKKVGL